LFLALLLGVAIHSAVHGSNHPSGVTQLR
jgi:hypothetical protein